VAKGQYEKWQTEDNLILLEGWARDGLTDEQIAHNIGIRRETLYDWKKKYPNISNALKKGKEVVDYIIENDLFKKAHEEKNLLAMIFWLKNRRPDKWRDKPIEKIDFENIPRFIDDIK
jgi:DNA-binding XRE family transcriptional regulator